MKSRKKTGQFFLILFLVFIVAQAFRPAKNGSTASSPKDITTVVSIPDSVMIILKKSCYDCHSNNSNYPWYDQLTPVNWWVQNHINEGKHELNFTEFADYTGKKKKKKLEKIVESIKEGWMPLDSYLWMHGDAKLSGAQKQAIVSWADAAGKTIQL